MKNIPLLIGTIVGSILLVVGIAVFFSNSNPTAQPDQLLMEPSPQEQVLGEPRHIKGPAEAEITIVEFSDFQCPACRAAQPLVKQVADANPDKVRVVYRHLPLVSIHPYAQVAAQASEVAAEQGKFWEYHDILFERQPTWAQVKTAKEAEDLFVEYAGELGIDTAAFRERITSDEIRQRVLADVADSSALDIQSTPTLFVNNQRVPAPGQLQAAVESLLNSQE